MKLVFIIIAFIVVCCLIRKQRYENTEYFQQTHVSYDDIKTDKGRIGEYYIYDYLKSLPGYRKYLFNLYIPKDDNTTAEIDVVLLHESGIYVILNFQN